MTRSDNIYNAFSLLGEISVLLQAFSCIALAVVLLVVGSMLVSSPTKVAVRAYVLESGNLWNEDDKHLVRIEYEFAGTLYREHMVTVKTYKVGEDIDALIDPKNPSKPVESLDWQSYGASMIVCAFLSIYGAYAAVEVVSSRKNLAALAGAFSFLSALT